MTPELTIYERKVLFIIEVQKHRFDRRKDVIGRFILYWTKFVNNDAFMRFEMCTSFNIKFRLSAFERKYTKITEIER